MLRYISEAVSLEMESQLCLPARYTFIEVMKLTVSSAESASRATSVRVFAPRHGTPCPVPMDWGEVASGRAPPSCGGLAEVA